MLTICQAEMCRAMTIYLKSLSPHDAAATSRVRSVKVVRKNFVIELEQIVETTAKPAGDPTLSQEQRTKANL